MARQYSFGFEVLNASNFEGYDYAPIANEPWNTESGGNTDFRAPYVGFNPNAASFKTVGNSAYDPLAARHQRKHQRAAATVVLSGRIDCRQHLVAGTPSFSVRLCGRLSG
jgi:hypothetical protein